MAQSPSVEQIRIKNVAGTYVLIEWDDIGGLFTYEIQKSANGGPYIAVDFNNIAEYFDQHATPNTTYIYRVRAVSSEYSPGDWTYSDEFKTYANNSYAVVAQSSVSIYKNFIDQKLTNANDFINFNRDVVEGVLIREGYNFSNTHTNIADIESYILFQDETMKIYGDTSDACGDRMKLMPAYYNNVFFMFERFQPVVRYSENNGVSWASHQGVIGRAGHPVGGQVACTTDGVMYIIGYDGIYALTFNNDVRWSATDVRFSSIVDGFSPGEPGSFRFSKLVGLPSGVGLGAIEAMAVDDDGEKLFVATANTVYSLDLLSMNLDSLGNRMWESTTIAITGDTTNTVATKNLICFNKKLYAFIPGVVNNTIGVELESGWKIADSSFKGIYQIDYDLTGSTRVYGSTLAERVAIDPIISNLSRASDHLLIDGLNQSYPLIDDNGSIEPATPGYDDTEVDPERVDHATRYQISTDQIVTNIRMHRLPISSFDGTTWVAREENYHYESQYVWMSGNRVWVNYHQKLSLIERRKDFVHTFQNTSETLVNGKFTFYADGFYVDSYPGYVIGMAFYRKDTGDLIGFFNLGYRTRDKAVFTWIPDRVVATAILASNSIDVIVPPEVPDNESDIVPPLEPMVYQFMPETFIHNEPLYVEFVEEYLKFMSTDNDSDYGQLYNLLRNHDINETAYLEMFYNDLSKRNVYLDSAKWTQLLKFINNRSFDIYSIKGIKDSYKFLFKLLYNEDVIITTEADSKYEFDIIIDSNTLAADMVGNRIKTPDQSGQADVVYYERYFDANGTPHWLVTLNNIAGDFLVGDSLISEVDSAFTGTVVRAVLGKEKPLNNEDYLQRGPTYYAISIQSALQVSKYRDDVLRFVHPVGFGFVGIMLITMFINSGVSTTHKETIIDLLQAMKWDMGLPLTYPMQIPDLNADGSYKTDKYGNIQYKDHPLAGQPFPLRANYLTENPEIIAGLNADQRRKGSYLWDSSNMRFIETRKLVNGRLKDGLTQRKDS